MKFSDMTFKRRFSLTLYKNRRLKLGEMSFLKDFVNDRRGDLYPVLLTQGDYQETVSGGRYAFVARTEGARVTRLLGGHFPYATYEAVVEELEGQCGFTFMSPDSSCEILFAVRAGRVVCAMGACQIDSGISFDRGTRLIVTSRRECFDIYIDTGSYPAYAGTFHAPGFENMAHYDVFTQTTAALTVCGGAVVRSVQFYMDCGVSQADMRPIRYENGEIMVENGKIYLTMSVRMQEGCYQGVFSWTPGTCELELTGTLFYDAGDGVWGNEVAASILYHRAQKQWYVWVCAFSHDHVLGHGVASGDVRFGVNVLDITLIEKMTEQDADTAVSYTHLFPFRR